MRSISSSKTSDGKLPSLHMWVQNNHSTRLGIYLVFQHTRRIQTRHYIGPVRSPSHGRHYDHPQACCGPCPGRGVSFRNHQVRDIVPTATVIVLRAYLTPAFRGASCLATVRPWPVSPSLFASSGVLNSRARLGGASHPA